MDKVLIVTQLFYPELVSTGQTLTELAEVLRNEMDIEVWCARPTVIKDKRSVEGGIDYKGIKIKRLFSTQFSKDNVLLRVLNQTTFAASLAIQLIRQRPEEPVLVLTNPPFIAPLFGIYSLLGGGPYVYLVFDVYPETAILLDVIDERGLIARGWNALNAVSFSTASKIIVIGRCMKEVVEAKLDEGERSKIEVIPVWADDRRISSDRRRGIFRERWGLGDRLVVGYAGNMGRFHDMETIMEAAHSLREHEDICFLFVGEGYKKKWCMEFVENRGLRNCIFQTYVDREELGALLNDFDVGLVSLLAGQEGLSVPSKTFGLMAASKPTIAVMSGRSEIARILVESKAGLVVDPGDAAGLERCVLELRDGHERRRNMGRNARAALEEKYSLEAISARYSRLLRQVGQQGERREPASMRSMLRGIAGAWSRSLSTW